MRYHFYIIEIQCCILDDLCSNPSPSQPCLLTRLTAKERVFGDCLSLCAAAPSKHQRLDNLQTSETHLAVQGLEGWKVWKAHCLARKG